MNKNSLKFKELEKALEKQGIVISKIESRRNGAQKLTYIGFDNMYIRYICFVDGEGYYEQGKEHSVNVYCSENGDTKYGAWFKNYNQLAKELVEINKLENA